MEDKFNQYENLLGQLSALKEESKEIQSKLKAIENDIQKHMLENKLNKLEFRGGSFELNKVKFKETKEMDASKKEKTEKKQKIETTAGLIAIFDRPVNLPVKNSTMSIIDFEKKNTKKKTKK